MDTTIATTFERASHLLQPVICIFTLVAASVHSQPLRPDATLLKTKRSTECILSNGVPVLLPGSHDIRQFNSGPNGTTETFSAGKPLYSRLSPAVTFESVTGPYGGTVRSVAVDSGGWLFAATDGGVYRSTDNGSHWETRLLPTQSFSYIEPITVLGPNVIAAETDFSAFISTDRGDTWNSLFPTLRGFAVDTNGDIYAGSIYGGLCRSRDTAKTWIPIALEGKQIYRVALCGAGHIICESDSGLYYSSDNGGTWTQKLYTSQGYWYVVSDRQGHLYTMRGSQVLRSSDFGDSWEPVVLPGTTSYSMIYRIYSKSRDRLFVVTYEAVLESTNSGDTWTTITPPSTSPLTVGEDARGELIVGGFFGIYRRNEQQQGWEELNRGIHAKRIMAIQFSSAGSIFAHDGAHCYRSSDNGTSWTLIHVDSTVYVYPPMLSTHNGGIFIAASFGSESGLVRSMDDGVTWDRISVLANYYALYGIAEGSNGDVLAATSFGDIYRSTNEGNSWSKVVTSPIQSEIKSIAADKAGNFYAAKDSSVLVSHGGIVWKEVPLVRNFGYWQSLTVDSQGGVYLGSENNGVYHSTDQGRSWNLMNDGIAGAYIMSITADDSGNVFAGTATGIFRLVDSVDRWEWFSAGIPYTYTMCVAVSPQGPLYGGTQDYGMYRSVTPMTRRIPTTPIVPGEVIQDFSLHQNYPNPFNDQTVIEYEIHAFARVEITIYDLLGQIVATLVSDGLPKGTYEVHWTPKQLSTGVYFCRMTAGEASQAHQKTIKLLYLR